MERQHPQVKRVTNTSQQAAELEQRCNSQRAVHEAIIELYLQVKVRSNDEVSKQAIKLLCELL
jgi:hypothetical protein